MADDEEYQAPGERLEQAMTSLMRQFGAVVGEQMRPETFEYKLVPWSEVNEFAADGWELRAANITLTVFVMARKRGAADEAAALLERAQRFGLHIRNPGELGLGPGGVPYGLFGTAPLDEPVPPALIDDPPAPDSGAGGLEG